jgi:hypothetical protein
VLRHLRKGRPWRIRREAWKRNKAGVAAVSATILALTTTGLVIAPNTARAACSETTKFVEEYNNNPDTGNTQYYGIQGSTWTYNHLPICSGGAVYQSFFMRLTPDYTDWVETGIGQFPSDSSGHDHAWGEWRYFPANAVVRTYDTKAGVLTTGTWYSVRLQNGTGNTWDLYIAHTSSPGSSWNHLDNTGDLGTFTGMPESELSRHGTGNADDLVNYLQEQYYYLGPFHNWQHMGCDYNARSILDWYVVKLTEQSWQMFPGTPPSGAC